MDFDCAPVKSFNYTTKTSSDLGIEKAADTLSVIF